jgi:hypothetical protein
VTEAKDFGVSTFGTSPEVIHHPRTVIAVVITEAVIEFIGAFDFLADDIELDVRSLAIVVLGEADASP